MMSSNPALVCTMVTNLPPAPLRELVFMMPGAIILTPERDESMETTSCAVCVRVVCSFPRGLGIDPVYLKRRKSVDGTHYFTYYGARSKSRTRNPLVKGFAYKNRYFLRVGNIQKTVVFCMRTRANSSRELPLSAGFFSDEGTRTGRLEYVFRAVFSAQQGYMHHAAM